jgi:hypothetical protein
MFETYRQLGREHDAELQREAARRALARTVRRRPLHPVAVLIGAILLLAFTLALVLPACSLGNHRDAGAISTVVDTGDFGAGGVGGERYRRALAAHDHGQEGGALLNGSENRALAPHAPDFT